MSVVGHSEAFIKYVDDNIIVSGLKEGAYTLSVTVVPDNNHNSVIKGIGISVTGSGSGSGGGKTESKVGFSTNSLVFDYGGSAYTTLALVGCTVTQDNVYIKDYSTILARGPKRTDEAFINLSDRYTVEESKMNREDSGLWKGHATQEFIDFMYKIQAAGYKEDGKKATFCKTDFIRQLAGSCDSFIAMHDHQKPSATLDEQCFEYGRELKDGDIRDYLCEILGGEDPTTIQTLKPKDRKQIINELKNQRISCRQIARITGLSLYLVTHTK
jgi:hypothetical protein